MDMGHHFWSVFLRAGKRATTDIEDDWQMMCLCPYSRQARKKRALENILCSRLTSEVEMKSRKRTLTVKINTKTSFSHSGWKIISAVGKGLGKGFQHTVTFLIFLRKHTSGLWALIARHGASFACTLRDLLGFKLMFHLHHNFFGSFWPVFVLIY